MSDAQERLADENQPIAKDKQAGPPKGGEAVIGPEEILSYWFPEADISTADPPEASGGPASL